MCKGLQPVFEEISEELLESTFRPTHMNGFGLDTDKFDIMAGWNLAEVLKTLGKPKNRRLTVCRKSTDYVFINFSESVRSC